MGPRLCAWNLIPIPYLILLRASHSFCIDSIQIPFLNGWIWNLRRFCTRVVFDQTGSELPPVYGRILGVFNVAWDGWRSMDSCTKCMWLVKESGHQNLKLLGSWYQKVKNTLRQILLWNERTIIPVSCTCTDLGPLTPRNITFVTFAIRGHSIHA